MAAKPACFISVVILSETAPPLRGESKDPYREADLRLRYRGVSTRAPKDGPHSLNMTPQY